MSKSLLLPLTLALACALPPSAHAVGQAIDVRVTDRSTGEVLAATRHRGEWWIAGRPGARYAVTLTNRNGQRTLGVLSIDGVNAISGDTAAWHQTGYVLDPYARTEVAGWRKNMEQVAAFEFTALPDSYASRTGRPGNVGVIGVAVFNEKRTPVPFAQSSRDGEPRARREMPTDALPPAPSAPPSADDRTGANSESERASGASTGQSMSRAKAAAEAMPSPRADRLGTGHGEIEQSGIRNVRFERRQSTPDEVITIRYDRLENLVAMGIVPAPMAAGPVPRPFPDSSRFVADPPPRR